MTQIDLEFKSMAKSALREYISSRGAIDWEQRRYEIAKDVLCSCFASGRTDGINTVDYAVSVADELIMVLKEGGEK